MNHENHSLVECHSLTTNIFRSEFKKKDHLHGVHGTCAGTDVGTSAPGGGGTVNLGVGTAVPEHIPSLGCIKPVSRLYKNIITS